MRITSDPQTNKGFELLANRITKIAADLAVTQSQMASMMSASANQVSKGAPHIPFKIAEEGDSEGIKITIDLDVRADSKRVRIELISVFHNTKQGSETDDEAIARAKRHIKTYSFRITDLERSIGRAIRQIGPFKYRRDNATKNQYQLTLVTTKSIFENAVQDNPAEDPYKVFPFTSFIVRLQYDDGTMIPDSAAADRKYFTIGDVGVGQGPPAPAKALIVSNAVNLITQAADADVVFKILASARVDGSGNPIDTFGGLDIDAAHVHLQPFDDAADLTGETDTKLKFGGPVTDPTAKFILITATLPLGKHYKWVKTTTRNAAGIQVVRPPMTVDFYAGGDPPTAGIPEIETFTVAAAQKNNTHTLLTATIKQFANSSSHLFAALLKRLVFTVQEPSDSSPVVEKKVALLDQEDVFVQGATTVFTRKVQHTANKQNIKFGATIFGINHTTAVPIKRDAVMATGNSTFSVKPSPPNSNLINTAPDDDTTDGHDAYADFTVYSTDEVDSMGNPAPTQTFRETGTDQIAIVLRKSSGASDDDPDDMRLPKKFFPVEETDLDKKFIVCRVRDLKLGRNYIWRRNLAFRSGIHIASTNAVVPFRAGLMALDPAGVTINVFADPKNKRNCEVEVYIGQASPAVLLKNIELWQADVNTAMPSDFVEVRQRRLKDRAEFQMTPIAGTGTVSATITLPATSTAVLVGSGTSFMTQLVVGGTIIVNGQIRIIKTITSNTSLTVERPYTAGFGGQSFTYLGVAVKAIFRTHIPPQKPVRFFVRLRAVGNKTKDSATITMNGMGSAEAPTQLPSNPFFVDIIQNTLNGDIRMGHAKVTFRVWASWMRNMTGQGGSGPNGEICFVDVGADSAKVVLVDATDDNPAIPSTMQIERYPLPSGPITDPDPTTGKPRYFVDIETTVLTAGKAYKWKRNVTFRNGTPARSTGTSVMFVAGGSPGQVGLPELANLSLTLQPVMTAAGKVSSSHLEAVISFIQAIPNAGFGSAPTGFASVTAGASTVNGTSGANFLANSPADNFPIAPGYRITIAGQIGGDNTRIVTAVTSSQLTVDRPWTVSASNTVYAYQPPVILLKRCVLERKLGNGTLKKFAREPLLDDVAVQTEGFQQFSILIPTPKKTLVGVQATLIAVASGPGVEGNSRVIPLQSMMAGDDPAFEDTGAPSGGTNSRLRWRDKALRVIFKLPTGPSNNMNTHSTCKVIFFFTANNTASTAYLWDPLNRTTRIQSPYGLGNPVNPLTDSNAAAYLIDIGKGSGFTFNNNVPHSASDANMDIDGDDTVVYDKIVASGGFLFCQFYIFNRFNDTDTGAFQEAVFLQIDASGPRDDGTVVPFAPLRLGA